MRWSTIFTLLVSLFLLGTLAAPASGPDQRDAVADLQARQDTESATITENTASEASTTATRKDATTTATDASTTPEAKAIGTNASATTSMNATTTATAASATSTVPSLDGATASSQQEAADSTRPTYSGGLPIQPIITPAFGVGGFILMALGAVLTFIGVRKQWVQIFLSTGFLTALGVTVLIIYVMSPPVSNAVQGGYLVAVFFTGAVFGGLSLVFREICEGLGCLLGGFCLSMWFLALKSGGLLSESGPKAGMIITFTAGFYSLSFSHYTRPYALVGCTSFSGATALVLGIDCYSRAGLKEFWIYIWGLNDNVFPLRTDTYPVTRGIRVELAATIIISVLGVISQIRLWNVIKDRRAEEEKARKEASRKIEEEDAEAGRRLEEKNLQERAEWELIYGNGKAADVKTASISETAVGDSRRDSDGFTSSDNDKDGSIELKEMRSPDVDADGEKSGAREDATQGLEAVPEEGSQHDEPRDGEQSQEQESKEISEKGHKPATPVTHVLGEANDIASENGAIIGSEVGTPRSKRFSGRELLDRVSWRSSHGAMIVSESQEALVVHDDANSSVLGVADELNGESVGCPSVASDVQDPVQVTEREINPSEDESEKEALAVDLESKSNVGSQVVQDAGANVGTGASTRQDGEKIVFEKPSANQTGPQMTSNERTTATDSLAEKSGISEASQQSLSLEIPVTDVLPQIAAAPLKTQEVNFQPTLQPSPLSDQKVESVKVASEGRPPTATTIKPESTAGPIPEPVPEPKIEPPKAEVIKRLDASTVKALPEQTSRVIHSYRTNEWAKHLADADTPDMEPIVFEPEPEVEETDEKHETAAFVDVDGLLQTPLTAQPPPIVNRPEDPEADLRKSYILSSSSPGIPRSKTRTGTQGLTTKTVPAPIARFLSSASVPMLRSSSGPTSSTQEQGLASTHNVSTPLLTITTPNQPKETDSPPRWSGPPPLLAVREDMVRNRMSSTSNRYDPWSNRNQSRQSLPELNTVSSPIPPPLTVPEERREEHEQAQPHDGDDIPLSKRRAMLQRQTMRSTSTTSLHSLEAPYPVYSPPSPPGDMNRSASRMAAWRQSVREEITQKRDPLAMQSPPISPVSSVGHRNTWGSIQQMREASSAQLSSAIADGMQRGNMTDLHRQAMRRMQASANRKL